MMNSKIYKSINFHFIRILSWHPKREKNTLYVTFDDGPEELITEFVLDELKKYDAKATFFCCGDNVAKHPELYQRIILEGHTVANHTYSHVSGLQMSSKEYLMDIQKAHGLIKSPLFRPPWGGLRFYDYIKLRYFRKFKIVLWDLASGDTTNNPCLDNICNRYSKVKNGDIILFHFCKKHEKTTRFLLPIFLKEMYQKGFIFKTLIQS